MIDNQQHNSNNLNYGKIVSVRGSVVDVFFEDNLPPIYTLLHTGKNKKEVYQPNVRHYKKTELRH